MLMHDSLQNYYMTNFKLMHQHKYSLTELENMLPWERNIYIDLLVSQNKREEETRRDALNYAKR